jgi:hypothetical protein
MTRTLKALGLAVVAALALSVVAAPAAQANEQEFTSALGNTPVALHAGQDNQHVFTLTGGRSTECATATFTGTVTETPTKSITIAPEYSNCTVLIAGNKLPATITFPVECKYSFTAPKTSPPGVLVGTVDVICQIGFEIQIHVYEKGKEHIEGLPSEGGTEVCTYKVGAQNNLKNLTYTNNGNGTVLVDANVTNVAYNRTRGTTTNCGAASSVATYTGKSTVSGTFGGEPEGIHVE